MEQIAGELPFGLQYDDSRTRVVNDSCDEVPNKFGGGSIELETNLGLAFSGGSINLHIPGLDQMATQTVQ